MSCTRLHTLRRERRAINSGRLDNAPDRRRSAFKVASYRRELDTGIFRSASSLRPPHPDGQRGKVAAMRRNQRVTASGVRRPQSERLRRRRRWYFALMGVCLVLILLAWNLVRLWSTTAAVVMSVVAAVLPPIAVVIANWGEDR